MEAAAAEKVMTENNYTNETIISRKNDTGLRHSKINMC